MGVLMLTRRKDEKVLLIDKRTEETVATVIVTEIGKSHIKLGFDSPKHINIVREEVMRNEVDLDLATEFIGVADDLKALGAQLIADGPNEAILDEIECKIQDLESLRDEFSDGQD